MRSWYLRAALLNLRDLKRKPNITAPQRRVIDDTIKYIQKAEYGMDKAMLDAKMQGLRNAAFPDDLIGWLDDDFESPEERWARKCGYQKKEDRDAKNEQSENPQEDDSDNKES